MTDLEAQCITFDDFYSQTADFQPAEWKASCTEAQMPGIVLLFFGQHAHLLQAARQQALQALEAALLLPSVPGRLHRQRLVIADDNMYYRQVDGLGIMGYSGPFATSRACIQCDWISVMHGCTCSEMAMRWQALALFLTELSAHCKSAA